MTCKDKASNGSARYLICFIQSVFSLLLQRVALCCSVLQCVAVCCIALYNKYWADTVDNIYKSNLLICNTTHFNTLQLAATHCTTLHHTVSHCTILHHTAPHCTIMHHTAPRCNTLKFTAIHCNSCNTLQHTATHCNTLQHTATLSTSQLHGFAILRPTAQGHQRWFIYLYALTFISHTSIQISVSFYRLSYLHMR